MSSISFIQWVGQLLFSIVLLKFSNPPEMHFCLNFSPNNVPMFKGAKQSLPRRNKTYNYTWGGDVRGGGVDWGGEGGYSVILIPSRKFGLLYLHKAPEAVRVALPIPNSGCSTSVCQTTVWLPPFGIFYCEH